ncbi:MAG: ROK family transcriptional regulator [Gemmatimonadaceae bacterium]|nr:ROK family transcriptional regulator [Gemmatimonadaceae bacterium]
MPSSMPRCQVGARQPDATRPRDLATAMLRLIWEERRISRADIARRLEVSRSTVSEIVDQLLPVGLVREAGVGASSGGRRPIVLEFCDDAYTLLGVDIGASHVSVVLTDLRGQVLAWEHREHPVHDDPDGTRALVVALCDACREQVDLTRSPLAGIGVALPTPVDPKHPERVSRLAMSRWQERHGLEALVERYGVPVFLDNDANLGALAEHWWGAARGRQTFTFIKVGTGIGAGHFIDGHIFRGASGVAGEIGHVSIDVHGKPCVCGNRGCLTTYVGAKELVQRAHELAPETPGHKLELGTLSIIELEKAALVGDPLARKVIEEAAQHLGTVIAGMLNLMNPEAVILWGRLARLREQVLVPIREAVMRRTFVSAVASSEIHASALGDRGIAIGAATLVLDAVLHDPTLLPATHSP